MADPEHLQILTHGVHSWNKWRAENRELIPDLSAAELGSTSVLNLTLMRANQSDANPGQTDLRNVNFRGANLHQANLALANVHRADMVGADLSGAILSGARCIGTNLCQANLRNADLREADLRGAGLSEANLHNADLRGAKHSSAGISRADFSGANLGGADLSGSTFLDSDLSGTNLSGADLRGTKFSNTDLRGASISGMNLRDVNFAGANLVGANLSNSDVHGSVLEANLKAANLSGTNMTEVNLKGKDLSGANLCGANLTGANLTETNLTGARLCRADLSSAILIRTNLENADLTGCRVYGISAWDLELRGAVQKNIVITPHNQPTIQLDRLDIAQFIYILLNNAEIRHVIDTITSKVVLILGRFTAERKAVLDALLTELRKRDYLPVLFDWEKPSNRDIAETVSTLAHMARFVIADITDAKSIPQELMAIVPNLPSVPVQPLLLASQSEYGMFEHFKRYAWVLPVTFYESQDELLLSLERKVIAPAETKLREIRAASTDATASLG